MPDVEREAAQVGLQLLPLWPDVDLAADPTTAGGTE
jgi:hypothetical protein